MRAKEQILGSSKLILKDDEYVVDNDISDEAIDC